MDKEKFQEESKQRRQKNTDALTRETLMKMLEHNVRMFDTHYIRDRVIQIIDRTLKKLDYKNKAIEKARRAFLDVLIDGAGKNLFNRKDELKAAKKGIKSKDKEKKRKAIEELKRLEREESNNPQNSTEERNIECEPVCQHVAKTILSREWLLKDDEYVKGAIELDDELLLTVNALSYIEELFGQVYNALDHSYLRANEKHWNCPREKIKMSQLDNRLKDED